MGLILRTTHDNLPAGATVSNSRLSVQQMDNNFIYLQSIAGGNPDLTNLTTDIIPAMDSVYSLGTSASQWKSLHVSGQTIYIGGVPLSTDGTSLVVNSINLGTTASPLIISADSNNNTLVINGTASIGAIGPQGPRGATGTPGAAGPNGLSSLSLVTLTVASASQYMESGWITPGHPYLITDADPYLYGTFSTFAFGEGTNILLHGVDSNNFSTIGFGKFYNPNYDNFDVWDQGATYSVNDKVIYGGRVWNLTATASVGSDNYWNLQSDWEAVDYTDMAFYNVVWNEVEYNIDDNYITSRYDAVQNNRVTDCSGTWYFNCETHPIQSFRWGHDSVQNCRVDNSYFGCLNFVSGYIWDVELKNGSMIWDINLLNNGRLQTITLSNFSELSSFIIDGGYVQNINISNGSSFGEFTVSDTYCYIENITINNSSNIGGFTLSQEDDNYCYLSEITIDNNSSIENFTLHSNNSDNSYFSGIKVDTDSHISGITATASYLENISLSTDSEISGNIYMDNSNLYVVELSNHGYFIGSNESDDSVVGDGDITITDSNLENIKITNNSVFTGPISITNNSRITELYMENSYIGGYEQDNDDLFSITIDNSTLENLVLEGYSYIANLEMYNSTLSNTKLSNYSKITSDGDSVYIEDSTLDFISVSNHSYIGYDRVEIINGTNWYDVKLDNYSKIGGYIYFNNSRFGVISLNNNSKFWGSYDDIFINGSDVHYISLDNHSEITGYLNINDSSLQNVTLSTSFFGGYNHNFNITNGSTLQYVNLSNGSWFEADNDDINIKNGSTVEYINLTNWSWIDGRLDVGQDGIDCYLGYLDLTNDSYFGYGIYVKNLSRLQQVKLENNSRLVGQDEEYGDIFVYDNSTMQNIEITNASYLSGWMDIGEGSYFQNIKIDNNSKIQAGIYVYGWDTAPYTQGSTFENVTVTNGSSILGGITIGNYGATQNGYGYLGNVTVTNGSLLGDNDIYVRDQARLEYITINNYSRFNKVYLADNNTKMYYIDLNNYSYIDPNNLELSGASEIKYLTLDNHSHIMGQTYLYNSSKIKRVQMANYSKIDGYNQMNFGSEIQYMSMLNVSDNSGTSCYGAGFTDFYLSGTSSIHGLDMKWSTLGGLYLSNSSKIEGLEIDNNSKVYNVELNFGSSLLNSKIINSYLDGDLRNPGAYGSLLLNYSWMENVIFDTVDFPSWNSNHFGISLQNGSAIRNMSLKNMCANDRVVAFQNNYDNRRGFVEDIYLNNSYLENISIDNSGETYDIFTGWFRQFNLNNSFISSIDANLSYIDDITLSDNSSIIGLKLEGAGVYDLFLGEGSSISDLEIHDSIENFYTNSLTWGSEIVGLKLNNSWLYENNLSNAALINGRLNLGDIDGCNLTNTGLGNFSLNGSYIYNLNQSNQPISYNFDLKNIEFDFNNDAGFTYNLTSAVGHNNTIKYQFTVILNGLSDGYVSIPRYIAPGAGWYIEKAVIDSTTLVVSGTTSFSLGLQVSHPESVMDNVDSTILSNKVKVFDLANGGIPSGLKSTGLDWIGLYVHDGTVTSGTMNIEVTLKNTNYFTTWWI